MLVSLSLAAETLPDFIAYAKANPGKINMASAGPGSAPGMYGELFKSMAGVDLVTVNYRGSAPDMPDLFAGRVQVLFEPAISAIAPVVAGKVRALGVTNATRIVQLPMSLQLASTYPAMWPRVGKRFVRRRTRRRKSSLP